MLSTHLISNSLVDHDPQTQSQHRFPKYSVAEHLGATMAELRKEREKNESEGRRKAYHAIS